MRKPDELALFRVLREPYVASFVCERPSAHDAAVYLEMHPKRLQAILLKWDRKGWWEWGVSARFGWFTDKAPGTLGP